VHNERVFMGRLFPSFDGPVRVSPYVVAPRKRRWWPMAAAFGAGMVCVLVVAGPWKNAIDLAARKAPATQSASPDLQVMSVEAAPSAMPAVTPSVPVAPLDLDGTPAGASKAAEQPMPRARPATADPPPSSEKSANAKASGTKANETKGSNNKPSNAKASSTKRVNATPTDAETPTPGTRNQANARNSAKTGSQADQSTGMVQVDEEELPDGRRVPVYRRPTIFDGVRTSGSQ
jgi:hypothetical protein